MGSIPSRSSISSSSFGQCYEPDDVQLDECQSTVDVYAKYLQNELKSSLKDDLDIYNLWVYQDHQEERMLLLLPSDDLDDYNKGV